MATAPELEQAVEWKVCSRCDSKPRVVWLGSLTGTKAFGYRCACPDKEEFLNPDIVPAGNFVDDRLKRMMRLEMERHPDDQTNLATMPPVVDGAAPPMTVAAYKQKAELLKAVVRT